MKFDKSIIENICKSSGLSLTEEHKNIVSNLLDETIKLGIFTTNHFTEDMFLGLVPFVKTYVEGIIEYGKDPDVYIKSIAEKLKRIK